MRREFNTLTAARKQLTMDEQRTIGLNADAVIQLINEHPEIAAKVLFSKWMKDTCAEVDRGERQGSGTQAMLDFYKMQAEGVAHRICGPTITQTPVKASKRNSSVMNTLVTRE